MVLGFALYALATRKSSVALMSAAYSVVLHYRRRTTALVNCVES